MKQKELTISIPEGYEIDKEKSTFERIVFKPTDSKVRSWRDYMNTSIKDKWGLLLNGTTYQFTSPTFIGTVGRTLIFDSQEDAEAVQALIKLRLLRNQWVGDWKPKDGELRFAIRTYQSNIEPLQTYCTYCLEFPTKEMVKDFIKTFHPLLEQAKLFL